MMQESPRDVLAVRAILPRVDDMLVPEFVDLLSRGSHTFRQDRLQIKESTVSAFRRCRTFHAPAFIVHQLHHHWAEVHGGDAVPEVLIHRWNGREPNRLDHATANHL